jgi:1-acyl-sn-glycerol-3-phosphate acyltransferase
MTTSDAADDPRDLAGGPAAAHADLASVAVPRSPRRQPLPDVSVRLGLYGPLRVIARGVMRLALDVRVERADAVPSSGPVLLAGNHRGILDAPLMAAFVPRPARFLAKSELFRGWVARLLGWLGQIPVDRGRPDREALRRAVAVLEEGHVLGMFPEGTRGAGELTTVQHGIAYVALRVPGVPIVPVACLGTERAMPMGARRPRFRSRVDIVFGEPFTIEVPANPRARSAVAAAAEEIRQALAAHVAGAERRLADRRSPARHGADRPGGVA